MSSGGDAPQAPPPLPGPPTGGPPPLPGPPGGGGPPPPPPPPPPGGAGPAAPPPLGGSGDPAAPPPLPDQAPAADPGPIPEHAGHERAAFQVTEQTRTYPCHSCGDSLVFDIKQQKLGCPSCGNSAEIDLSGLTVPVEHDLRETMSQLRAFLATQQPPVTGEKEIVCQNCGGHTTFTGTLTAIRCPYCATPIQRDDIHAAPARLAVDGVLPFQVDEKVARTALEEWINGRWFAPTEFKKYKETGAFSSIYAAYFTYDADTATRYQGQRGDNYTVTVGSGENQRTETRTRWSSVGGVVGNQFDDVTVLANDGFDPKRVKALEPWPTQGSAPFTPQFVAGHLCRTYDHDAEETFPQAQREMESAIDATIRADIGGDQQRIERKETAWNELTFKHLLLPIWLLTVIYEQKPFQVFINGVTGEVQGQRPWSKVKLGLAIAAGVIALILVLVLWSASKSGST